MRMGNERRLDLGIPPLPRAPKLSWVLQPKLAINRPGDEFEQEADRVADRVMRVSDPGMQRNCECEGQCPDCKKDEQKSVAGVQLKRVHPDSTRHSEAPPLVHEALASSGESLDSGVRKSMERHFGHDFGRVRVHVDGAAERSARAIGALAYTSGSHIVFGRGEYEPSTREGQRLLAHELTHVVQQTGGGIPPGGVVQRNAFEPAIEDEARNQAAMIAGRGTPDDLGTSSEEEDQGNAASVVQRQAVDHRMAGLTMPSLPLNQGGSPMPPDLQKHFEWRFGRDLSAVRVHADGTSDDANRGLNANAFTYGADIWMGGGQLPSRNRLLAHELTHVIQQTQPRPIPGNPRPVTTLGQPRQIARDPVTDPSQVKPAPSKPHCASGKKPGSHSEDPKDHTLYASGRYSIWSPPFKGESVQELATRTIRAWMPSDVSPQVANRVLTEIVDWQWSWESGPPARGCQSVANLSIDDANRLLQLLNRDRAIRGQEKKEFAAGLPQLERPHEGPITSPSQTKPGGMMEMPLDPTSQYQGGEGKTKANYPAFPASMEGPDIEVPSGIGTYSMNIDYATNNPYLLISYSMNAIYYSWEIFNVTDVLHAGMGSGVLDEARRMKENKQAQAAAQGATRQKISNDVDQLYDETAQSLRDLRDPLQAARGKSAIDVVTRAYANRLNLELLPASAIITAGGWLIEAITTALFDKYHHEKEIAFKGGPGWYMVRCIAQPASQGRHDEVRRLASVRAKLVEVRPPEYLLKNTLYTPDAVIAELEARQKLTDDPIEIARINTEIAAIEEQSGALRYDRQGKLVSEKAAGDIVAYLTRLVAEKEEAVRNAPEWKKDRLNQELKSLQLRLKNAVDKREGTVGVHHRPRVAFTSKITGETYPMLIELTEIPADSGARVRLMDLTIPDREPKDLAGTDLNDATQNALQEFAHYSNLGRGYLLVRLPPTWPGGPRELPVIETADAGEAVARRRLEDLAKALLLLSIVVPGVGEVSMVITAALAAERLIRRALNGTLRLDESSVSDMLAIVGAIAQGAQLIGKLRVVRAGDAFVGALESADQTAIKAAAEAFESARKAGKVLSLTSTVINAGGMIWGDLVMIQDIVRLQQDEVDGKITHAEARRRLASTLSWAVANHGIMLAGALRPRGAGRAAGEENFPPEKVEPEGGRRTHEETIPESELDQRATAGQTATQGSEPAQPLPRGVRARFKTPDGLHELFILNDGTIYRCSLTCAQLKTWYGDYLTAQRDSARQERANELKNTLEALEGRTQAGENSTELNEAIGRLDVQMREFIAPDLARELQQRAEEAGTVVPGQAFLTRDQVRRLLTVFNVDQVQALTDSGGLAAGNESDTVRSFANAPEEFLLEARKLGLVDAIQGGGEEARAAADFLGRATRIREVHGVRFEGGRFSLTELHAAYLRGDAILSHGPLQTPEYLNDMIGGRAVLGNGKLDVGTSGGRLPGSMLNSSRIATLDFVIIVSEGRERIILGRHHSGLSSGRASVFAAGELRFDRNGFVVSISNGSGHYLPSSANLDRAAALLYDRGMLDRSRPVTLEYLE